jgi:hypothetical protein
MFVSRRLSLGALAFAMLVVACSSTEEQATEGEGGATDDGGQPTVDATPPGPPCSRLTTLCGEGGKCEGAADCTTGLCRDGTCKTIVPSDGVKNGDETDVDCGGTASPACADLKACLGGADCTSGVCKTNVCQVPTFTDAVQNGDETGKDCGGPKPAAPKCPTGEGCLEDNDCDKVKCDLVAKKCKPAANDDGIKNLDETGIDCGGPTAAVKRCDPGQGCATKDDCANVLCNAGTLVCDPPSKTDGLKNGTESDIDCGGGAPTNAPKCFINQACLVGTDCTSGGCSAGLGNKCAPLSCATAEVAGITSCGAIETGEAGAAAAHESCCKSLVLPTRTTKRLDKYEITAGRFRTFLTKVGPNVRAWVQTYIAANGASQLAQMIAGFPVLANLYPAADRFDNLSLTSHMALDIDNYNGIRGCANYDGSYSANTYWMDNTHYADFGLPPRSLARTVSDEKSMNCAMPIMFAAFCAWDGGEMAKYDDYLDVWTQAYPWGPTDLQRPNYNWCGGTYQNGGFVCQCDGVHNIGPRCPAGGFQGLSGAGVFYEWPRNTDRSKDNEPLIGSPGRFTNDASALKSGGESWFDMFANLAEYTGDFATNPNATLATFCDMSAGPVAGQPTCTRGLRPGQTGTSYTGIPQIGMIGQTWEGHEYGKVNKASNLPATFQYGKFGARCVRPANPF